MIIDVLQNSQLYEQLHPKFKKAFTYLHSINFDTVAIGKYEIEGDDLFAIVNEFETKDKNDCEVEAHRKYIDIQYLVRGTEMFGYAPLTIQKPVIEYDETNDAAIYKEEVSYVKLEAGMFVIFYPSDLHQPEVKQYEPVTVKKVVVKIKL